MSKIVTIPFQLNNSTGTQDITTPLLGGLTPKACRVLLTDATSLNTNIDGICYCIGYTDGTFQGYTMFANKDNVSPTQASRRSDDDALMSLKYKNNSILAVAVFSSWLTNGIRINVTTAPSSKRWGVIQFFAGNNLTAAAGRYNPNTTQNGTTTVTVGFQLDYMYQMTANTSDTGTSEWGWVDNSEGYCVRGGNQGCWHLSIADNASTTGNSGVVNNTRSCRISGAGIEITSITSTQFVATTRDAGCDSGRFVYYLAIRMTDGNASLRFIDSPTSTGNASYTGVGFRPTHVEIFGNMAQAYVTGYSDGSVGANFRYNYDGGGGESVLFTDYDNVSTADCVQRQQSDTLYHLDHTKTLRHQASFVSFGSDGVTLNFTTADGTARKWIALFINDGSITFMPHLDRDVHRGVYRGMNMGIVTIPR